MRTLFMIDYSKFHFNIWKQKDFSLAQRSATHMYRFYRTCEKVVTMMKKGIYAGVKRLEYAIHLGLNENTQICRLGIRRAGCPMSDVVILIVADSSICINTFEVCYV